MSRKNSSSFSSERQPKRDVRMPFCPRLSGTFVKYYCEGVACAWFSSVLGKCAVLVQAEALAKQSMG